MQEVIVVGAAGRMGKTLIRVLAESKDARLVAAVARPGGRGIGLDAGDLVGLGTLGVSVTDDFHSALNPDGVVVDFTNAQASMLHLRQAAPEGVPIVIGSTGLTPGDVVEAERLARGTRVLMSSNMSLGMNLLFSLVGQVARVLGETYDTEIFEMHHRGKKDSPSGSALGLGQEIAQATGRSLERDAVYSRRGIGRERGLGEIGFASLRAGDVIGDHTVIFAGNGERIEFTHRAHSRETFAQGALRAALWLVSQPKGLYSIRDVLRV
jgi:4-hydroxy-tetrahydrodipicolinate reductase